MSQIYGLSFVGLGTSTIFHAAVAGWPKMKLNPLSKRWRGLTQFVHFIAAAEFGFIVISGYPFGRFGYPDLAIATMNVLIFTCTGFTAVFVPNIILNGVMLLAAIPLINFDIANWNSNLRGKEIKNGWLHITLYCIVGLLLSAGYLIYRLLRYSNRR